MIEHLVSQIQEALEQQDYPTATQLVKKLREQDPRNSWGRFFVGRLQEAAGRFDMAEQAYRQVLQETSIPKIALQARQSLQRLVINEHNRRQQAIADATADPENADLGFLILEPVMGEARARVTQNFARIMKRDPKTVRLTLPSRGWQLHRTGAIGELRVYTQEFCQAEIPAFCHSLREVQEIEIFRVQYFQAVEPEVTIVCLNQSDQAGTFSFDWSEVTRRVSGGLPIFEQVVDRGAWGKLQRLERTQDYVQVLDLHLPQRNCILRLCDNTYQFQEGLVFSRSGEENLAVPSTTRINWNNLVGFLNQKLAGSPLCKDFKEFAETTIDHQVPLARIQPYLDLSRKIETHWDSAFQLYSTLVWLQDKNASIDL